MTDYQPVPPPPTSYQGGYSTASYNVLAIVGFVLAFVVPIGGIVCGHIALAQIRRTHERGRGLALAATILGYVFVAFFVVMVLLAVLLQAMVAGSRY
jgi:hypothetical protein